jgi:hypothetical protein
MKKTSLQTVVVLTAFIISAGCIAGCGAGSAPAIQVDQSRVDKLTTIRSMFDQAHGDYNALSPEDKTKFLKLCDNDQTKADTTWNLMKNGPAKPANQP